VLLCGLIDLENMQHIQKWKDGREKETLAMDTYNYPNFAKE
jgi:hypothetical protein